jgi:hypothetical protein
MTKMQVINFAVKTLLFVIQSEIELSEKNVKNTVHCPIPYSR